MKNFGILSSKLFILIVTPLRKAKKGVRSSIYFALIVINTKIVTRKFLSPADLSRAQTLYIHKLANVVMVGQDENLMLATFQIVFPSLKNLNNC